MKPLGRNMTRKRKGSTQSSCDGASFIGKRNSIKVKAIWTLMYADERRHLPMESAFVSVPNMLSGLPMSSAASQVSGERAP
jgi:hypothetical protein